MKKTEAEQFFPSPPMPHTTKTLQAISAPRTRQPAPPRAPLTAEQKKEKRDEREDLQQRIDIDVGKTVLFCSMTFFHSFFAAEWFSYTNAKAVELGAKYDKRPRYFLDIFFQGGAHMVNHQEKTNPYNAFKAEKAAQRREGHFFTLLLYVGLSRVQRVKPD